MTNGFGLSASEINVLGTRLIDHLKLKLNSTENRKQWTKGNFDAIRTFDSGQFITECFPSAKGSPGDAYRPQFLWDFIAYVQGAGILIAAESEWENKSTPEIMHDFEKLLYVRSPIKLMMCRVEEGKKAATELCDELFDYMQRTCTDFSPGELFIIYCLRERNLDGSSGDAAFTLQVDGEPVFRNFGNRKFELV
jgi:hypothetical protein